MEIKPTGPPQFPQPASRTDEPQNKGAFNAEKSLAQPISEGTQPLEAVRAQFSKADLLDPAKVDTIIAQAADELVRSTVQDVSGRMSPIDRAHVSEWIQSDPLFREKLLSYLQRVLT